MHDGLKQRLFCEEPGRRRPAKKFFTREPNVFKHLCGVHDIQPELQKNAYAAVTVSAPAPPSCLNASTDDLQHGSEMDHRICGLETRRYLWDQRLIECARDS